MSAVTTNTDMTNGIIDATTFNGSEDYIYAKPKINPSGGKNIGILNTSGKKGLYLSTPLMLTWGISEYTDEKTGRKTYDMSLQFPKEEYNNENVEKFLENIKAFEAQLKADAITNCKEWMNKPKMSAEVIDALWTPMLKYPKDQSGEGFDYNRPPTLRVKIPVWDDEWKIELYDLNQQLVFPNESGHSPMGIVGKGVNVATVIQCGGIWFANGKFGVTWKLVQAVVKPRESMKGKCLISLSSNDKSVMENDVDMKPTVVDSSDDEEEDEPMAQTPVKEEVKEAIALTPQPPDAPKKKVVRRKKAAEE